LQPDEDICEVALPATILIRDIFAKYFGMEVATTPSAGQSVASPYDLLLRECATYAYNHAPLFESNCYFAMGAGVALALRKNLII
jgi:hypothetical protein